MTNEDEMTVDERRKYLRRMQTRYLKTDHQERSILPSKMEQVTDLHRKSPIRLLKSDLKRRLRRRQRSRTYGPEVAVSPPCCANWPKSRWKSSMK